MKIVFFFSSRRRHTRWTGDWSSDVCSSDLNGVMDEPPVKLAIRKGRDEIEWRTEHEWPLKRTKWTKLYFDLSKPPDGLPANAGGLVSNRPEASASRTYPASSLGSMGSTSAASSQVMGGGIKPGMGVALET